MQATSLYLYMYAVSCLALLYILSYVVKLPTTFDHTESHASFFLRLGAIIFGLGSVIFHLLELILYIMIDTSHEECVDYSHTIMSCLAVLFVFLQVIVFTLIKTLENRLTIAHQPPGGRGDHLP